MISVAFATAPQVRPQAPSVEEAKPPAPEIVITGRRPAPDPVPLSTIPAEEIDTYSAETVGEAIEVARQRLPGGSGPVIINGRRLGDIGDITALPPEAIQRIEILPPSAGARRGLGGGTPIVNVVLKEHFRLLTTSVEAATSTDGGGNDGRVELAGAAIDGQHRTNAVSIGSQQGSLRYSDRFTDEILSAQQLVTTPATSLRPSSSALSFLGGKAIPFGQKQLSLSFNGNLTGSDRELGGSLGTQRNRSAHGGVSATLSGLTGRHSWTVITNGSMARASGDARGTDAASAVSRSSSVTSDLTINLSGPLLRLFDGTLSYSANTALSQARLSQSLGSLSRTVNLRRSVSSEFGMEVPLHQQGSGATFLGDLSLRLQGQLNRTTGSDTLLGYENALSWSPVSAVTVEWTNAYQALGANGQFGALIVQPDVLLFDPVMQQSIRIRQILGGNPALKIASQRRSGLRVSFADRVLGANLAASAYYERERIADPIFSPTPSVLIEQAYPARFIRDVEGHLIEVDARSINAYRQSINSLSLNLSLSGELRSGGQDERTRARVNSGRWTLGLNYATRLSERLQLTPTSPKLDLRSAQIGALGGGSGDRLGAQAGIGNARFNGQLQISWSSSTTLLGQGNGASGINHQPFRISTDAHVNLGRRAQPGQIRKLRLGLRIDNLLNARPRIRFPDRATPFALSPANLDPIGRLIRISLRSALR